MTLWQYYVAGLPLITRHGSLGSCRLRSIVLDEAVCPCYGKQTASDGEKFLIPGLDAEVAAVIEQIEQECLAVILHRHGIRACDSVGEREDAFGDA